MRKDMFVLNDLSSRIMYILYEFYYFGMCSRARFICRGMIK